MKKRLRQVSSKKSSLANFHARRICEAMISFCASVMVFVLKGIAEVIPFNNPIKWAFQVSRAGLCDEYVRRGFIAPFPEDDVVVTKDWAVSQYNEHICKKK